MKWLETSEGVDGVARTLDVTGIEIVQCDECSIDALDIYDPDTDIPESGFKCEYCDSRKTSYEPLIDAWLCYACAMEVM